MSEGETSHLDLETLHGLLDGALSFEEAARAEAHLAACAQCAEEIASLKAVFDSLARLPEEPLRLDLRPRVMAGLELARRRGLRIGWLLGAQAAGAALGIWISWPFLGRMLSSRWGDRLPEWIASELPAFIDRVSDAWETVRAPALGVLESLLRVRWDLPIHPTSLAQILGLIAAGTALCLVGNGLLLRALRVGPRRDRSAR